MTRAELNERTKVPLGSAVVAMLFLAGLVAWAVRVESAASATAANTAKLEQKQNSYAVDIAIVKSDLRMLKRALKVEDE